MHNIYQIDCVHLDGKFHVEHVTEVPFCPSVWIDIFSQLSIGLPQELFL